MKYKMEQRWEYKEEQKCKYKNGTNMRNLDYTMELTWNTEWNRHGLQNGADMEYTMEQNWNTKWNRNR